MAGALDRLEAGVGQLLSQPLGERPELGEVGRRVSADGSGQTARTSSSNGSCWSYERTVIATVSSRTSVAAFGASHIRACCSAAPVRSPLSISASSSAKPA